jgi:nucleoid-associated protein Lsr2
MAKRMIVVDDLDGSDSDVSTVSFTVDGIRYAIDLSSKNQKKFREALAPYIDGAQKIGGRTTRRTSSRRQTAKSDKQVLADIRAWARAEGYEVSDRGRISAALREAYDAAH